MAERGDVEQLLRYALAPVEPPDVMVDRLDRELTRLTGAAADELADWELGAMRDPRNWARPLAAGVVGGLAAGALVLVRARQQRGRGVGVPQALERGLREVSLDVRRRLRDQRERSAVRRRPGR